MPVYIASDEADRDSFARKLKARGMSRDYSKPRFRSPRFMTFLFYDYKGQLRVSYWAGRDEKPFKVIPKADPVASAVCSTDGHEDRPIQARGLCGSCYGRWKRWSKPENLSEERRLKAKEVIPQATEGVRAKWSGLKKKMCSVHPKKKAYCRGLCSACYGRWYYWNNEAIREKHIFRCRRKKLMAAGALPQEIVAAREELRCRG